MKKNTILFLALLGSISIFAQTNQQTLLENTWYLAKIEVDEELISVPGFDFISDFSLQFLNDDNVPDYVHAQCSNSAEGSYNVVSESTLQIFDYTVTLAMCPIEELALFFNTMDNSVYVENLGLDFQYTITPENDLLKLEIAGENGNKAFYYNTSALTTKAFNGELFKIYPNPSSDFFNISITDLDKIEIFDLLGKRIVPKYNSTTNETQIDIQNLASGNYILQISKDNQTESLKFIKK